MAVILKKVKKQTFIFLVLSNLDSINQNQSVMVSRMRLLRKRKWCDRCSLEFVTSLMERHRPLLEIKTHNELQKTFLLLISSRSNQIYDIYKHYFYLNINKYKTSIRDFLRDLSQLRMRSFFQLSVDKRDQCIPLSLRLQVGKKCNFAGFCRRCEVSGGFFMKLWIR